MSKNATTLCLTVFITAVIALAALILHGIANGDNEPGHQSFNENEPCSLYEIKSRTDPENLLRWFNEGQSRNYVQIHHIDRYIFMCRRPATPAEGGTPTVNPEPAELTEVLAELDDIHDYAAEIEVQPPSPETVNLARRLIAEVHRLRPAKFAAYPVADGEIAIDVRGRPGNFAVLCCAPDHSVLLLTTIDGQDRRVRYANTQFLPDEFLALILNAL